MHVSVESKGQLERCLTVQVPAEVVDQEVDTRLKKLRGKVKLDGFRKGKVPQSVVNKRYGLSVRQEVLGDVIQQHLSNALQDQDFTPACPPKIDDIKAEPGHDVEFKASIEILPEITLADFSAIEIEKPVAEVTDEDVDNVIEKLRKQHAEWTEVDRAATDGDQLSISFEGSIDGERKDQASAEDFNLELGSGQFIEGFEAGLVGASKGDERVLNLKFPDEYHDAGFAGKPVEFKVEVKAVKESTLPELDDEFVKKLGHDKDGVDGLKKEISSLMSEELDKAVGGKVKDQVCEGLLKHHEFALPASMLDQEKARLHQAMHKHHEHEHDGECNHEEEPELLKKATESVTLGLLLRKIIETHELKADPDQVRAKIEQLAKSFPEPSVLINFYYSNQERLEEIRFQVLEQQAIDKVVETAKVIEKKCEYKDLVNV